MLSRALPSSLALRCYLRKELRDQRVALIAAALLLPLAALACAAFASRGAIRDGQVVSSFVVFATLYWLCVVLPELLPCDSHRGTAGFLERMPLGLSAAFRGKFVFALLALLALVGAAWLGASALRVAFFPELWSAPVYVPSGDFLDELLRLRVHPAWLVLAPAWVLAVSAWVDRGVLALPGAAVVMAPVVLGLWLHPGLARSDFAATGVWLCALAGVFVAWLSFARGRRFGRGLWGAASRGLAASAVLLPLGFAPLVLDTVRAVQSDDATVWSYGAILGEGARYAYVTHGVGTRRTRSFVEKVDLHSGAVVRLTGNSAVLHWDFQVGAHPAFGEHRRARLHENLTDDGLGPAVTLRTRDGERVLVEPDATSVRAMAELRAEARALTPLRQADDRRAWFHNGALEMENADGSVTTLPWEHPPMWAVCGHGFLVSRPKGHLSFWVFDLTRRRAFLDAQWSHGLCWVLPERWLVADVETKRPQMPRHWRLLDPVSGAAEPVTWLADGERVTTMLDDGRLLVEVLRDARKPGPIFLVDWRSGERTPLLAADGGPVEGKFSGDAMWPAPMRLRDGARILAMQVPRVGLVSRGIATLAPGATQLTPFFTADQLVGELADGVVLVLDAERQLARVEVATGMVQRIGK